MALEAPAGTGPAGIRLLAAINEHDERENWIRDAHEHEVMLVCMAAADRLQEIATVLATLDTVDPAWSRLATTERQIGATLRVNLEKLGLLFGAPPAAKADPSAIGRKAAAARWGRQHGAVG